MKNDSNSFNEILDTIDGIKKSFKNGSPMLVELSLKRICLEGRGCIVNEWCRVRCGGFVAASLQTKPDEADERPAIFGNTLLSRIVFNDLIPWALKNQSPAREEPKRKPDSQDFSSMIWNLNEWQLYAMKVKVLECRILPNIIHIVLEIPSSRKLFRCKRETPRIS